MSRARVETVLAELARDWELSDLALDDNDFFCLQTADGVLVNIDYFEQDDALAFYTTVCRVPAEAGGEIYQVLLESNCDWAETAGGTLALDPTSEFVLLTAALPAATLDLTTLAGQVETLAQSAIGFKSFIASLVDGAPGESSQETADFA